MTLPLTTCYVKIEDAASADEGDAYSTTTYSVIHDRVPGHVGPASFQSAGERYSSTDRVLYVDDTVTVPTDARVTNLTTGEVYAALWTDITNGLGLDHRKVGLRRSSGDR